LADSTGNLCEPYVGSLAVTGAISRIGGYEGTLNIPAVSHKYPVANLDSTGSDTESLFIRAERENRASVRQAQSPPRHITSPVLASLPVRRNSKLKGTSLARFVLAKKVRQASHRERPTEDGSPDTAQVGMALHSQLRGILDGFGRPLLGWAANGSRIHDDVRIGLHQKVRWVRKRLACVGADDCCRASLQWIWGTQGSLLRAMAQHSSLLRASLREDV
jgi:hypothetical protein